MPCSHERIFYSGTIKSTKRKLYQCLSCFDTFTERDIDINKYDLAGYIDLKVFGKNARREIYELKDIESDGE